MMSCRQWHFNGKFWENSWTRGRMRCGYCRIVRYDWGRFVRGWSCSQGQGVQRGTYLVIGNMQKACTKEEAFCEVLNCGVCRWTMIRADPALKGVFDIGGEAVCTDVDCTIEEEEGDVIQSWGID